MSYDALTLTDQQRHALELLRSRQSPWPLAEPAPSQAELDAALDIALRAPDHGALRPWRFVLIRGAARERLAAVFAEASRRRDPDDDAERFARKAYGAPVLIAMAAHLTRGHKVPVAEQVQSTAAAAMNLLNALHVLGYGGFWSTGVNARDPWIKRALGFGEDDELLGYLYVGTPKEAVRPVERPARQAFVREWTGE